MDPVERRIETLGGVEAVQSTLAQVRERAEADPTEPCSIPAGELLALLELVQAGIDGHRVLGNVDAAAKAAERVAAMPEPPAGRTRAEAIRLQVRGALLLGLSTPVVPPT